MIYMYVAVLAVSSSHKNLLEIQILSPQSLICFSSDFWYMLKFKNHWKSGILKQQGF